jgi:hypothetical protein
VAWRSPGRTRKEVFATTNVPALRCTLRREDVKQFCLQLFELSHAGGVESPLPDTTLYKPLKTRFANVAFICEYSVKDRSVFECGLRRRVLRVAQLDAR